MHSARENKQIKVFVYQDEKIKKNGYFDPRKSEIVLKDINDKKTLYHELSHFVAFHEDVRDINHEKTAFIIEKVISLLHN